MKKLCPQEVDVSTTPIGPANLLDFHLPGLGFWIFFMLKRPLEPHYNDHILANENRRHISSQRQDATILASLSLCIFTVLYISYINRNCVLLYLCVYGFIYDTFLLYFWISEIFLYISLLYLLSHFMKIIWISGISAGCS